MFKKIILMFQSYILNTYRDNDVISGVNIRNVQNWKNFYEFI